MWSILNASFIEVIFNTILGLKSTNFIESDELSKNPSRNKVKKGERDELSKNPSRNKVKKGDCLGNREPLLICKEEDGNKKKNLQKKSINFEEKCVTRIKVKMTKQAAARLVSKCKEGGVLEFRDVAHELAQIPVNRVNVVSSSASIGYGGGVLKTIPEEIN